MSIQNPLKTRADVAEYALSLLAPLLAHRQDHGACFRLGATSAHYPDHVAGMEAFSRPLWAIAPLLAGKHAAVLPYWTLWREGLIHGVDPTHPAYWGDISDYDQRMVEMAAIAVGMCIAPEYFWQGLPPDSQEHLYEWLKQINRHRMGTHNWVFFRILVNLAFIKNGLPHSQAKLDEDLANVEAHYEDDGWYFDLPSQRDYYTPWAYHYYSLLYAQIMRDLDPERCATFATRSKAYAPQFAAWFDRDGAALPYGRSLTYRFAQGAFYSALAFGAEDSPDIRWGEMKGLWLRNLRWWSRQPILTGDGILSIGYGYPNLCMAENYNAPGSPYWAMKTFIALALPPEHPFWQAEEASCMPPRAIRQPSARMLITRDEQNAQVQAYAAGNHAPYQSDAKYEKFAYSTAFAFSIPHGMRTLEEGAFDSMLALSDDGAYWRVRYGCESFEVQEDRVLSVWRPYPDVTVSTEIIPRGDWHIRRHTIESKRALQASEAAYAIAHETNTEQYIKADSVCAYTPQGLSGIISYRGYQGACIVVPEPNTNLLYPRTVIPCLRADIPSGKTVLACAVLGSVTGTLEKWRQPPGKEEICG